MPFQRYGVSWPDSLKQMPEADAVLHLELVCFRDGGTERFVGGIPRSQHFKNICRLLWGKDNKKKHFVFHPWANDMVEEACTRPWLWLSGSAGCGKSDFGAIWGIVNWLCSPEHTAVLVTSTSLKNARQLIWGAVVEYFTLSSVPLPGKLLDSFGVIRTDDGSGRKFSDKCGIHLITGEKTKLKENIGKIIGIHNKRVLLIGDELPELSPALVEAAKSNLIANQFFQMVGMGNFKSVYDPFGVESTPLNGWGSVTPDDVRWETANGGVCLRFDGLKAPNVLLGKDLYPGYTNETLKKQKASLGENSAAFWRMCRSFPCPEADANRIYSDADMIKGKVHEKAKWLSPPTMGASLDPAWTNGGDKAVATFGKCGVCDDGKMRFETTERIEIREDVRKKDESRAAQVARQFRDLCKARGIPPEMAAYDISGGGAPFGALLAEIWSPRVTGVQFGGAPSNRIVNITKGIKACDAYDRRVTELWYVGLEFMQSDQIRGLPVEVAKELKERRYDTIKSGEFLKMKVEKKEDMKLRINFSPDSADSWCILLELFRQKLGFVAGGMMNVRKQVQSTWSNKVRRASSIYDQENLYQVEELAEV